MLLRRVASGCATPGPLDWHFNSAWAGSPECGPDGETANINFSIPLNLQIVDEDAGRKGAWWHKPITGKAT